MNSKTILGALAALFFVAMIASPAKATDRPDIVAGLGTFPLMTDKISGDVTLGIIYDPTLMSSKSDAENIKKIVDAGIDLPGGGKLSALLVSVEELGKLSRVRAAFITPGLESHFADIALATSAASVLTMTTDVACVKAGTCIIGVATKPGVTIYFNKTAADAAKIEFSQAFAMLVRQL
jgi:hypothetical protein